MKIISNYSQFNVCFSFEKKEIGHYIFLVMVICNALSFLHVWFMRFDLTEHEVEKICSKRRSSFIESKSESKSFSTDKVVSVGNPASIDE